MRAPAVSAVHQHGSGSGASTPRAFRPAAACETAPWAAGKFPAAMMGLEGNRKKSRIGGHPQQGIAIRRRFPSCRPQQPAPGGGAHELPRTDRVPFGRHRKDVYAIAGFRVAIPRNRDAQPARPSSSPKPGAADTRTISAPRKPPERHGDRYVLTRTTGRSARHAPRQSPVIHHALPDDSRQRLPAGVNGLGQCCQPESRASRKLCRDGGNRGPRCRKESPWPFRITPEGRDDGGASSEALAAPAVHAPAVRATQQAHRWHWAFSSSASEPRSTSTVRTAPKSRQSELKCEHRWECPGFLRTC